MTPKAFLRFASILAIAIPVFVQPITAQQSGGGQSTPPSQAPPSGGSGSVGKQPGPGTVPPTGRPTPGQVPQIGGEQQQNRLPEMQRPIFLSGKVMLDDGTPPPDSVVIEMICNGVPRPQAYTDSKGRFNFQVGQNSAMMPDASYSSGADASYGGPGSPGGYGSPGMVGGNQRMGSMGTMRGVGDNQLMGCELRASLPGFRSDQVNLSGRRMFDNPDVGVIILHRLANVEGTTISMTSLQAPKKAKKAYEKARKDFQKKKFDDARKELEKAVEEYPKYAAAWYLLGVVQQEQKQFDEARKSYAKALDADSKYVSPYMQLALLSARENKWQEVAETTDRILKLDPFDYPQAYFVNSVANYNLGKMELAEKNARQAQKLDTMHRIPKINRLLGLILAEKHDYTGAAQQMKDYLKFAPSAQDADQVRNQLSQIERLTGGTATVKPQE